MHGTQLSFMCQILFIGDHSVMYGYWYQLDYCHFFFSHVTFSMPSTTIERISTIGYRLGHVTGFDQWKAG